MLTPGRPTTVTRPSAFPTTSLPPDQHQIVACIRMPSRTVSLGDVGCNNGVPAEDILSGSDRPQMDQRVTTRWADATSGVSKVIQHQSSGDWPDEVAVGPNMCTVNVAGMEGSVAIAVARTEPAPAVPLNSDARTEPFEVSSARQFEWLMYRHIGTRIAVLPPSSVVGTAPTTGVDPSAASLNCADTIGHVRLQSVGPRPGAVTAAAGVLTSDPTLQAVS
jgi:hypothetical protein